MKVWGCEKEWFENHNFFEETRKRCLKGVKKPQVYSVLLQNKTFVQQPIISFLYMCDQNNIQELNILSKRLLMKGKGQLGQIHPTAESKSVPAIFVAPYVSEFW